MFWRLYTELWRRDQVIAGFVTGGLITFWPIPIALLAIDLVILTFQGIGQLIYEQRRLAERRREHQMQHQCEIEIHRERTRQMAMVDQARREEQRKANPPRSEIIERMKQRLAENLDLAEGFGDPEERQAAKAWAYNQYEESIAKLNRAM